MAAKKKTAKKVVKKAPRRVKAKSKQVVPSAERDRELQRVILATVQDVVQVAATRIVDSGLRGSVHDAVLLASGQILIELPQTAANQKAVKALVKKTVNALIARLIADE
ncbi:MAG: hypothetical protein ABIQ16_27100 [Polyangiaceae bacterium]